MFTLKEALDTEVGHCETQDRQFVQLGDDIWGERQQAGQPVQLSVQPVPVPLGWVGFLVGRDGFPGEEMHRVEIDMSLSASVCLCLRKCSSNLLHTVCSSPQCTSKVRTFFGSEDISAGPHNFSVWGLKVGIRIGFR